MATITYSVLYKSNEAPAWPSLSVGMAIPNSFWSGRAHRKPAEVGLGFVKGVTALLSQVQGMHYDPRSAHWTVYLESRDTTSSRVYTLGGTQDTWHVPHPKSYHVVVAGAVDALTINCGEAHTQEFRDRWREFLQALSLYLRKRPPYTIAQLQQASADQNLTHLLMGVCDSLYYTMREHQDELAAIEEQDDPQPLVATPGLAEQILFEGVSVKPRRAPSAAALGHANVVSVLERMIGRGGTALLWGPTGVGKTKAAKMAAMARDAVLCVVPGHPGLNDLLMYGATRALGDGSIRFVDGYLTEAWRLAMQGERPVVLLLNELLRVDSLYHSVIINALDALSGDEVLAHPKRVAAAEALGARFDPDESYYPLELPTGEVLLAPCRQLSIVATTNMGSDYVQMGQALDAALLGRFKIQIEIARLPADVRAKLLVERGLRDDIAAMLVAIEDDSASMTYRDGGLLARELNYRVLENCAELIIDEVTAGGGWRDAILSAATVTVIPFVCPRDANGQLDEAAVAAVLDAFKAGMRKLSL